MSGLLQPVTLGAAYYPEQVPVEQWAADAELMAQSGVRTVRMGEHAWAMLEPESGRYDFAWLEQALNTLHQQGIRVLLGVPTPCPPSWMFRAYPDLQLVDVNGLARSHGSRHTHCPNHDAFRAHARALTRALAERLHSHPAVLGWQIDNELSISETHRCYCDGCRLRFQAWLRGRYTDSSGAPSLQALNDAWGTAFWSQRYSAWEEIPTPRRTVHPHNPGLLLSFARFASDQTAAFVAEHAAILRQANPRWFLTHNLWEGTCERLDLSSLEASLDAYAADAYPRYSAEPDPWATGFHYALTRRGDRPFWVTELQGMSALNFRAPSLTSRPGELRLWAWQALAHGARHVLYFPWRTARAGGETFWQGLIGHDGRPGRFLAEVARTADEVAEYASLLASSSSAASCALLFDWSSCAILDSQLTLHPHISYAQLLQQTYAAIAQSGLTCDVVFPNDDLSRYRLLVAPMLYMVDEQLAERLERLVEAGAVLVLTFRSGVVDSEGRAHSQPLPGPLARLCGLSVREYGPILDEQPGGLQLNLGAQPVEGQARAWYDLLDLEQAQPSGSYTSDYYAGATAVAERRLGRGRVVYLGSLPERDLWIRWLGSLAREAGLSGRLADLPPNIEAVERRAPGARYLFLLNHSRHAVGVESAGGRCLLGSCVDGRVRLAAYDVAILEYQDGASASAEALS